MKLQLTHSELCEILSKNLGVTVESVDILQVIPVEIPATEQKPQPHNPYGLPPEQYGANEGYRLLDEDEVKERHDSFYIEKYVYYWDKNQWSGNEKTYTYRTKLSREELTKLP
jgi:hypothetical protein